MRWRERDGLRWIEAELGEGALAAFTTRVGGTSTAPYESLNLGVLTGDEREAVLSNRERLRQALGLEPGSVAMSRQVHGASVVSHESAGDDTFETGRAAAVEADGHVTAASGLGLLVLVADCLPVALSGERGVAMLHCGWRGLAAGIVEQGVARVGARAAAIGPGIGPCCYEVGEEVATEFERFGEGVVSGRMLDLAEAAERALRAAGVETIERSGLCTACEPELFFSHRRDAGQTGRQGGLAWRAS